MDRDEWVSNAIESVFSTPDHEQLSAAFVKALLTEIGCGLDEAYLLDLEDQYGCLDPQLLPKKQRRRDHKERRGSE